MGSDAVAIVLGAQLATRSHDTEYPFRQDSDFWYLTGFAHPDAVAILSTGKGPSFSLFVQPRDPAAEVWTGYRPGVAGAKQDYSADEAHDCGDLLDELPALLRGADRIYHTLGRRSEIDHKLVKVQEQLRRESKSGVAPASLLLDPRSILHEMRLIKSEAELAIMRRAAEISEEAHAEAAALLRPDRHEYEIQAALEYAFRRRGASGPAYNTIVAGGRGAATLHYIANDRPLREGELVLIDAGAEFEGYASDVTRTYPIDGRFRGAGRAVYEAVLAAQEAALTAIRPGTTLPEIHNATVRCLVEGMLSLGLLSGSADDLIEAEAYKRYYMHGTSHWLGLDAHDVGSYALDGRARTLEPGIVFTVEPGIYVASDDDKAPESLRGIGVRIEDDVVVTAEGIENLNSAIPKQPEEVEAWVRSQRTLAI